MKVARITYITQMYSFEIFQDGGRPDAILDLIEPEKSAIRSADHENNTIEQNKRKWKGGAVEVAVGLNPLIPDLV